MRMLKSGLKLVLNTEWVIDMENSIIDDIVANCNVYAGSKYYHYDEYADEYVLQYFDVKLPLNHRYIMTYYNPEDDTAATVYLDTFGIEEMYEVDPDENPDQTGYQVKFLWLYNVDEDAVSGNDYAYNIANYGIRLNPVWTGNCTIRIYQID